MLTEKEFISLYRSGSMLTYDIILCEFFWWAAIPQRIVKSERENVLCQHMPNRQTVRLCRIFLPDQQRNVRDGLQPHLKMLAPVGRIVQHLQKIKSKQR